MKFDPVNFTEHDKVVYNMGRRKIRLSLKSINTYSD